MHKIKRLLGASMAGACIEANEGAVLRACKQRGADDLKSTVKKLGINARSGVKWLAISVLCAATASCSTTSETKPKQKRSKEYFSRSEYGVKASPRVADGQNIQRAAGVSFSAMPIPSRADVIFRRKSRVTTRPVLPLVWFRLPRPPDGKWRGL